MPTRPHLGALAALVLCLSAVAACTEPDSLDPNAEYVEDVVSLTVDQQALATGAQGAIDASAQKHDGRPNLLVELAPPDGGRLAVVALASLEDGVVREALRGAGTSARGAARIAGLVSNLRFAGVPSLRIYVFASDDGEPSGIVLHTIDRPDECSFATVSVFDLDGSRVRKSSTGLCS